MKTDLLWTNTKHIISHILLGLSATKLIFPFTVKCDLVTNGKYLYVLYEFWLREQIKHLSSRQCRPN